MAKKRRNVYKRQKSVKRIFKDSEFRVRVVDDFFAQSPELETSSNNHGETVNLPVLVFVANACHSVRGWSDTYYTFEIRTMVHLPCDLNGDSMVRQYLRIDTPAGESRSRKYQAGGETKGIFPRRYLPVHWKRPKCCNASLQNNFLLQNSRES